MPFLVKLHACPAFLIYALDVLRPFGRLLYGLFGCPKSDAQKKLFKYPFFSSALTKNVCWSSDQW